MEVEHEEDFKTFGYCACAVDAHIPCAAPLAETATTTDCDGYEIEKFSAFFERSGNESALGYIESDPEPWTA